MAAVIVISGADGGSLSWKKTPEKAD